MLWQRAFCMDFARVRDARATDWDASRVIHGRTLLCTAVNYEDPIYESAIELWLLFAAARARAPGLKTNVKSGGAVQQAVCFRTGLLATAGPVVAVCTPGAEHGAAQAPSTRTERRTSYPHRRCSDGVAAQVVNSYVRQVISEGAPRAPGAQYIWFGSFLPPLARHSS